MRTKPGAQNAGENIEPLMQESGTHLVRLNFLELVLHWDKYDSVLRL